MIEWSLGKQQNKNLPLGVIDKGEDFLSLATHELRTPLSIIKWYTEMLLDGDGGSLTDDQAKYLKVIQSSNQRAIDLIRSLLNVSRLDLGTFSISPTEVDLRTLVEQVLTENMLRIQEKNLIVDVEQKTNNVIALLDKQICLVVLRNIISNAILFSFKETRVVITLEEVLAGSSIGSKMVLENSLLLSVSDSGIGIPETEKEKIFSKLFKASNIKDENGVGSGLGLYIVKSAVSVLGGDVWFSGEEKGITTFFVTFPEKGLCKKEGRTTLD